MVKKAVRRVLIKISGEALEGTKEYGIDPQFLKKLALFVFIFNKICVLLAHCEGTGSLPCFLHLFF